MKSILMGLVVIALLALGFVYFNNMEGTDVPSDTNQPQNNATSTSPDDTNQTRSEIPENYYLHAEPALQYSIALPNHVDATNPQSGITRYRYVGTDNEANSEITDGYSITITSRTTNATSVESLAAQEIQGERVTVLEIPTTAQLAGQRVSRYTTESELGDKPIEHYVFVPGNGYEYIVSVNISPYENNQYREEITFVLETLSFLNNDEVTSLQSRIIPIAMLDYEAVGESYIKESSGKERGCDKVVLIDHVLSEDTTTPLNASLQQLFAYDSKTVHGWQNFIASQNDTLSFDRAEIDGGVAEIYLTGELGPLGGVCDNPRTAIQIEETALAYDTVDSVQLYLNGETTDLMPSGRGE